ncbi:hypothetical protein JCM19037_393 [Geomicrobium sp. JCM 19037]|uniref:hypothetical protein n=1 Tax=Geomicrobium sp. JCM 19037 TaxID=1460634 RepID=UPI00045F2E0C|nr:hypothetical protein [Geomicrobium sp. JCM 19037]GAK02176.1 hypothetical protein JCM19037_393 [Geomicrobium sp. JCM 19037]
MKGIIVGSTLVLASVVLYGFVLNAASVSQTVASGMFGRELIYYQLWIVYSVEVIVSIVLFAIGLIAAGWGLFSKQGR